nr:PREDICTED: cysteine-rich DPF motif domain-containing protein 1 [Megachile rotundata]
MESVASTSADDRRTSEYDLSITSAVQGSKQTTVGIFTCSYCALQERYDFKGTKPPFARQLTYLEECYLMKDPFSLPNKGEVLVLGADCNFCTKPVCLGCSIYFGKRFCLECASNNMHNLPTQLQTKIKSLIKNVNS